jgi:hypothetical protein
MVLEGGIHDRRRRSTRRVSFGEGIVKPIATRRYLKRKIRNRQLRSRDECAPLGQCRRASLFVDGPRDEMALLIEMIVHLGVN